jgi:hypothetical protein
MYGLNLSSSYLIMLAVMVWRCRLTISKPVLKAPMVSLLGLRI